MNSEIRKSRYIPGFENAPSVFRVEESNNLKNARRLGYKKIPGIFLVVSKIRRGMMRKAWENLRRKPRGMGLKKKSLNLNLRNLAERKAQRKFPNCAVLNSYWICQSGKSKWFEIILVDPQNAHVKARSEFDFLQKSKNRSRVWRGLTTSGRASRNLS